MRATGVICSSVMAHRFVCRCLAGAVIAVLAANALRAETGFLGRSVKLQGTEYRYVVYVPAQWTTLKKWPVILALHGSIEKGDDGISQSRVGLGHIVRQQPERFPAVIVMPQCRRNVDWVDPAMEAQALAALDASIKEFSGDPEHTYLTGFSMGGYGTWAIAATHPRRFAALVVICGGIVWPPEVAMRPVNLKADNAYTRTARQVAGIPVWVFHGASDRNVPVTESRRMVDALKALGAEPRYTEYKDTGHFMWDTAYGEPELPAWLLGQHRKASTE